MIQLSRKNGDLLHISAWQIETIQAMPDTLVTLVSGRQIYVKDTVDEVRDRMLVWFRAIYAPARGDGDDRAAS